jgi:N6-adenosine-specific RNA methylase IME4
VKLRRSHDPRQLRVLPTAESDLFVGMGFTTRKNVELCLLARRGSARREARNVREVILSPVREHSRKPDEARARIETYVGPGKTMVELFGRTLATNWTVLGNEVEKF